MNDSRGNMANDEGLARDSHASSEPEEMHRGDLVPNERGLSTHVQVNGAVASWLERWSQSDQHPGRVYPVRWSRLCRGGLTVLGNN
jgi:hypothetical protein